MPDPHGVEPGQHHHPRDRAHEPGEGVDEGEGAPRVDPGVAGRLDVRPHHVDREAERRAAEEHVPPHRAAREDEERDGDAERGAVPDVPDERGKARDVAPPGEELAHPAEEDHEGQRNQDGMGADVGDDDPHRPADEGAERERAREGEGEGDDAGVRAAERLEDPGRGETADVGREGDGEVEAPREDRDQHGEGEDPELRHLERDRLERREGEESGRRPAEEDEHRDEEDPEPDVLPAPGPEEGGEIEPARRGAPRPARARPRRAPFARPRPRRSRFARARLSQARPAHARPRLRRIPPPRPRSASQETLVVVIAARSTTPISIWNA